jgi:uncharacterized protein YcfL
MKKMHYLIWLSVLVLVGCARGTAPNIIEVKETGEKKIVVNDTSLSKKLTFGEVNLRNIGDGLEAQVIIQNATQRDVSFEYRFMWYDASGLEVSSLTAWIPSTLGGMEGRGFKSVSPSNHAVNFKLMIRKPHPITDRSQ